MERTFQEFVQKLTKVTIKSSEKINNWKLHIKLGQFMEEELDAELKTIKTRKAASLNEIPLEIDKMKEIWWHTS